MRFIKLGVISVLVFFLLLTAITLLFPSHQRISRAINIAAPLGRVAGAVNDLRRWDDWNRFTAGSGLTNKKISSPSAGTGAFLSSDQLTLSITYGGTDSVAMNWRQVNGRSFNGGFNFMQLYPDSVTVQWWFDFHFRWYPWEKLGGLVYDRKLGPVMEESLSGLKHLMENSP